jgi:hypothetical protein
VKPPSVDDPITRADNAVLAARKAEAAAKIAMLIALLAAAFGFINLTLRFWLYCKQ